MTVTDSETLLADFSDGTSPVVPLSELFEVRGGGTPSRTKPSNFAGPVPWVKISDMLQGTVTSTDESISDEAVTNSSAKLLPAGTVILSIFATVGRTALLGIDATTNQAIVGFIPKQPSLIDTSYFRRYLDFLAPELKQRARGVAQSNISIGLLRSLRIPIPPIAEQRRIVAILDRTDRLRANRSHSLRLMDELADAIFVDMFGPTPPESSAWPTGTIRDLLVSANYGTSAKAGLIGEYPVLRMGNVTRAGRIDTTDMKYVDLPASSAEKYLVRAGDVLFNRTNSVELVGKTAVVKLKDPVAFAGYLVRLRLKDPVSADYLGAFLNSKYTKRTLRSMAKSIVGMANINAQEVQDMKIPLPPISLQREFSLRVHGLEEVREAIQRAICDLDELFVSLQHRAFLGKL